MPLPDHDRFATTPHPSNSHDPAPPLLQKVITSLLSVELALPCVALVDGGIEQFGEWLAWASALVCWGSALVCWTPRALEVGCLGVAVLRLPSVWASLLGIARDGDATLARALHLGEFCVVLLLLAATAACGARSPPHQKKSVLNNLLFMWVTPMVRQSSSGIDSMFDPDVLVAEPTARFEELLAKGGGDVRRALWRLFRGRFACVAAAKVVADLSVFLFPVLLRHFLDFLQGTNGNWQGVLYVLAFGAGFAFNVFARAHQEFAAHGLAMQARSVLFAALCRTGATLTEAQRRQLLAGQAMRGIVATDCARAVSAGTALVDVIAHVAQLAMAFFLLNREVHWAFLSGLLLVLLLLPVDVEVAGCARAAAESMAERAEDRVSRTSQALQKWACVKSLGLEGFVTEWIGDARSAEMASLRRRRYLDAAGVFLNALFPVVVPLAILTTYRSMYSAVLAPGSAFASLAVFSILIHPVHALPALIANIASSSHAFANLEVFFATTAPPPHAAAATDAVVEVDGSFAWAEGGEEVAASLTLGYGEMVGVVGDAGAGKSSLLWALAGEMRTVRGRYAAAPRVSVATAPEKPFLMNGTLLENIVLGKAYDEDTYEAVTAAVSLDSSFAGHEGSGKLIHAGDQTLTEVQRHKINLARALYAEPDVLLLHEPYRYFDDEECHVLRGHILDGVRNDRRTVVVSSRHYTLLEGCCRVVEMSGLRVAAVHPPSFLEAVRSDVAASCAAAALCIAAAAAVLPEEDAAEALEVPLDSPPKARKSKIHTTPVVHMGAWAQDTQGSRYYMPPSFVRAYGSSVGIRRWVFTAVCMVAMQASRVAHDWWLSRWVTPEHFRDDYYLGLLGAVVGTYLVFAAMQTFFYARGALNASAKTHGRLVTSVFHTRPHFLHALPAADLTTPFARDIGIIDDDLPYVLGVLVASALQLVGSLFIITLSDYLALLGVVPCLGYFYLVHRQHTDTMNELSGMDTSTQTGMVAAFTEALRGGSVVKQETEYLNHRNDVALNSSQRVWFCMRAVRSWLGLRLRLAGAVCVMLVSLLAVFRSPMKDQRVGITGLALIHAYSAIECVHVLATTAPELCRGILSVARVHMYSTLPPEDEQEVDVGSWPQDGAVAFQQVSSSVGSGCGEHKLWCSTLQAYDGELCQHPQEVRGDHWSCCGVVHRNAPCMQPVRHYILGEHSGEWRSRRLRDFLDDVTFKLAAGQRVVVCGGRSAGKTTLLNALVGLREMDSGRVSVNSRDVLTLVDRKTLRTSVVMLDASPFIFNGSVQENLDPHGVYGDLVQEAADLLGLEVPLDHDVGVDGEGLTAGQRQLVNVGRVVLRGLRRKKLKKEKKGGSGAITVVIMDEALSHCDVQTERRVRRVFKSVLPRATQLVVTDKTSTLREYAYAVVMERGRLVESGEVRQLLRTSDSVFRGIVEKSEEGLDELEMSEGAGSVMLPLYQSTKSIHYKYTTPMGRTVGRSVEECPYSSLSTSNSPHPFRQSLSRHSSFL